MWRSALTTETKKKDRQTDTHTEFMLVTWEVPGADSDIPFVQNQCLYRTDVTNIKATSATNGPIKKYTSLKSGNGPRQSSQPVALANTLCARGNRASANIHTVTFVQLYFLYLTVKWA